MTSVRNITTYFGLVNAVIGLLGFVAPLVTGNKDTAVNTEPGRLLGIFAINWVHALLHLAVGVAAFWRPASARFAVTYMRANAILFGLLTIIGVRRVRLQPGIFIVMGMALNVADNVLHGLWAVIGAVAGFRPDLLEERVD